MSPSTRRAWIEIAKEKPALQAKRVALHPEGVDRNIKALKGKQFDYPVALHPEGVDRNPEYDMTTAKKMKSPSTRRAWIEIVVFTTFYTYSIVALHPEGVDRNTDVCEGAPTLYAVALHPEGVDRNAKEA